MRPGQCALQPARTTHHTVDEAVESAVCSLGPSSGVSALKRMHGLVHCSAGLAKQLEKARNSPDYGSLHLLMRNIFETAKVVLEMMRDITNEAPAPSAPPAPKGPTPGAEPSGARQEAAAQRPGAAGNASAAGTVPARAPLTAPPPAPAVPAPPVAVVPPHVPVPPPPSAPAPVERIPGKAHQKIQAKKRTKIAGDLRCAFLPMLYATSTALICVCTATRYRLSDLSTFHPLPSRVLRRLFIQENNVPWVRYIIILWPSSPFPSRRRHYIHVEVHQSTVRQLNGCPDSMLRHSSWRFGTTREPSGSGWHVCVCTPFTIVRISAISARCLRTCPRCRMAFGEQNSGGDKSNVPTDRVGPFDSYHVFKCYECVYDVYLRLFMYTEREREREKAYIEM